MKSNQKKNQISWKMSLLLFINLDKNLKIRLVGENNYYSIIESFMDTNNSI